MSLETFVEAYIECALWSSTDEDGDPLDNGDYELSEDARADMERDCEGFYDDNAGTWDGLMSDEQAGHDFWLTRNGHGAGFWDRGLGEVGEKLSKAAKVYGGCDLIVGDNGEVHCG